MNEIKRYEVFGDGFYNEFKSGDWCKYEDVEKLIKQNKDLIETIQAMIKIGESVK